MARQTVLVVDDDELMRRAVVLVLQRPGFHVLQATTGAEAQSLMLTQADINLLISDLNMPGVGGLQLAAWAKSRFPELKVLLMSGAPSPPVDPSQSEPSASTPFLAKPFTIPDFLTKIHQLLGETGSEPPADNVV